MIGRVGRVEIFMPLTFCPVEFAAVDDHASHGCAMPTNEFGCGMCDDMRTPFKGPAQIRGSKCIVDEQRKSIVLRDFRHLLQWEYIYARVADDLAVNQFCVGLNRPPKVLRIGWIDQGYIDSQARECIFELTDRPAEEGRS